jgi:hypothetical protein
MHSSYARLRARADGREAREAELRREFEEKLAQKDTETAQLLQRLAAERAVQTARTCTCAR